MKWSVSPRTVTITVIAVAVLSGGIGSSVTHAYFTSTETGSGTISAADSFGGSSPPSDDVAWDDADGDGQYDEGERTYSPSELANFDNQSSNLVIPESVGTVETSGSENIQITAKSITSEVKIEAKNGDVNLNAKNGNVDLSGSVVSKTGSVDIDAQFGDVYLEGATLDSKNRNIDVTAGGLLDIDGATIDTNAQITLRAQQISARDATISSKNGNIALRATENGGGELDATGATMDTNGQITLRSGADLRLEDATLSSKNGDATAEVGASSDTLYVEGATIQDKDDTLRYSPGDTTVDGTPASGSTQPN
ncbi:hypothetical protein HZS55_18460 [Halosimplex rubrum]|uniref:DUF4097 family beta strand repeat protein n=1 Tax=Halosimplex rubrum TaxID=869889 RepID=A0A7D5SZZ6_9EURY|nr:SipW-dependent-type signal peptide-containing protein [Halosimplex rubrum]QLH79151.1 hypothetical protein HZS55_18460 [Halosimplex rubrum]